MQSAKSKQATTRVITKTNTVKSKTKSQLKTLPRQKVTIQKPAQKPTQNQARKPTQKPVYNKNYDAEWYEYLRTIAQLENDTETRAELLRSAEELLHTRETDKLVCCGKFETIEPIPALNNYVGKNGPVLSPLPREQAPPKLPEYIKLMTIPGIGESKAKVLAGQGVTLASLLKPQAKNDQHDLPRESILYLKYRPETEIPREVARKVADLVKKQFAEWQVDITGSVRRHRPFSKDIDIVVQVAPNQDRGKILAAAGVPEKFIIAQGDERVNFLIPYNKKYYKVDMYFTSSESYYFMLMYLTGSKEFNIKCRAAAKNHGLILNQYGLYHASNPNGKSIVVPKSENDIYRAIFCPQHNRHTATNCEKTIPDPSHRNLSIRLVYKRDRTIKQSAD